VTVFNSITHLLWHFYNHIVLSIIISKMKILYNIIEFEIYIMFCVLEQYMILIIEIIQL